MRDATQDDVPGARRRLAHDSAAPSPRLDSLTGLRWIAALLVVLHHADLVLVQIGPLNPLATVGYSGVGFFFVLSGFVLMWSRRAGDTPRAFYRRRFARVYPLHMALVVVGLLLAAAGVSHVTTSGTWLAVVLGQAWYPTVDTIFYGPNGPSWSLSDEAFFYALFPLVALFAARARPAVLAAAVAGAVALAVAAMLAAYSVDGRLSASETLYILPVFRLPEFLAGIALAAAMRRGWVPPPLAVGAAVALAGVLAAAALRHDLTRSETTLLLLPVWGLLIASAARADLSAAATPFARPAVVTLGVWSFALYLVHWPLVLVLVELNGGPVTGGLALRLAVLVGYAAAATALAAIAWRVIEAPLERRLRGGAGGKSEALAVP